MAKKPNTKTKLSLTDKFKRSKLYDIVDDILIAAPVISDIVSLGSEAGKALSNFVGARSLRTVETPINIKTNFMTENVAGHLLQKQKSGWYKTSNPLNKMLQVQAFKQDQRSFEKTYGPIEDISFLKNDTLTAKTVWMPIEHPEPLLRSNTFKSEFIERLIDTMKLKTKPNTSELAKELYNALDRLAKKEPRTAQSEDFERFTQLVGIYNHQTDRNPENLRDDLATFETEFLFKVSNYSNNLTVFIGPTDFVTYCDNFDKGANKMEAVRADSMSRFQTFFLRPEFVDENSDKLVKFDSFEDFKIHLSILDNHAHIDEDNASHRWLTEKQHSIEEMLSGKESKTFPSEKLTQQLQTIKDSFASATQARVEDQAKYEADVKQYHSTKPKDLKR